MSEYWNLNKVKHAEKCLVLSSKKAANGLCLNTKYYLSEYWIV